MDLSSDGPHLLHITVTDERELEADRADLYVTVRGTSLFTGRAALTKAREVAQMVADLRQVGVGEDDVRVESVRAETASGTLGKSSSAVYSLRVRVSQLDVLGDAIGAVTGQKNAQLTSLRWGYPDDPEADAAWLEALCRRAGAKAARVAGALGVRLEGVHRFAECCHDPEHPSVPFPAQADEPRFGRSRARMLSAEDFDMAFSHTNKVTRRVEVDYVVSGFGEEGASPSAPPDLN